MIWRSESTGELVRDLERVEKQETIEFGPREAVQGQIKAPELPVVALDRSS